MARGGKRIGAGRKPTRRPQSTLVRHPSWLPAPAPPPLPPIEEFEPPPELEAEARTVWLTQAPHAFRQRTLTPVSAMAFARYCQIVVLERNERKSSAVGGANHRGLLRQINAYELQFLLIAAGKPMIQPATPSASGRDLNEDFFNVRGA